MKKLLVILLIGLLGIGGAIYGKRAYNAYQKEAQFQDAIARTVDADEIEASKEAVDLSWDECKEFTELLDSDEYNGFYRVTFDNPKDIDWNEVLADGAGIPREKITKEDKKFYLDDDRSYNSLDHELIAISGASIKDYVYKHTGTSIDLKDDLLWVYNKDKDVYYNELGYLQYIPCTCVSGVKLNDTYVLEIAADDYDFFDNPNKKMVLIKTENGYLVKSNVNVWEVGNDKKLTFDVDIPQLAADVRLVTYQSGAAHLDMDDPSRLVIIGDNQLIDSFTISTCYGDEEIGSDYYTNQMQYYFIKDNELEMRYCLSYDYDNTADEDNEAEENSLIATVKPTDYTKNIPDDEVMSLIEDIEENKFIDLVGKYTASEMIQVISKKY